MVRFRESSLRDFPSAASVAASSAAVNVGFAAVRRPLADRGSRGRQPLPQFLKKFIYKHIMEYSFKIHQNIHYDAWNWWDACNNINFGTDWSSKINSQISRKIKDKSKKEAYYFLIPYLKRKYQEDKVKEGKLYIQTELNRKFLPACEKIAKVMGRPLYRNNFHFYLTTFPSISYNKESGHILLNYNWNDPIGTFLHELCHLQFIHYWRENPKSPVSRLPKDQFENLKESLTVILDKDFSLLIKKADQGYLIHQAFRKKLSAFWKVDKSFNNLVKYGTKQISLF